MPPIDVSARPPAPIAPADRATAGSIALGYATASGAWIFLSDLAINRLLSDAVDHELADVMKGLGFIALTAWLLYRLLLRRSRPAAEVGARAEDEARAARETTARQPGAAAPGPTGSRAAPFTLPAVLWPALLVAPLTLFGVFYAYVQHRDTVVARIEAIADLRTRQVGNWLAERLNDARFVRDNPVWGELAERWQAGDRAARDSLVGQLGALRINEPFGDIALFSLGGQLLWHSAGSFGSIPPELAAGIAGAVAGSGLGTGSALPRGEVVGPYADADGHARLDLIAVLSGRDGRQRAVAVLRIDPSRTLDPLLDGWPTPSATGETLLVGTEADRLRVLSAPRNRPSAALTTLMPLDRGDSLAAQAVRGELHPGSAGWGVDYRGVAVFGMVRPVPDSHWLLVAKIDRSELLEATLRDALWVVLAGIAAFMLAAATVHLRRQQRELTLERAAREAQDARVRALSLLDTLVHSSDDAIFAKDEQGRYLLFNAAACRLTGKREAEVLGRDDTALMPPAQAAAAMALDRIVLDSGKTVTGETQLMLDDGPRVLATTKGPLRNGERIVGVFGISRDMTERSRDRDRLRQLSRAVEQSPESIVITDLQANIEYVNDAFVRVSGWRREEVLGRNPKLLQSGRTPVETYADMWATLTAGRPWRGQFFNRRRDGSEFTEIAIITPLRDGDGNISHYVAVKQDVTAQQRDAAELEAHRHRLEELVESRTRELAEARRRAELANRAKSEFLANMSHEIRTPMNAILGLARLLRRAGATPEQAEKLGKIDTAGNHLLSIINDILDLSKIEAGQLQLEQTDFALAAMLDHVRSIVLPQAEAKGLVLTIEHDGVPDWLRGDPTRLRQALLNYAGNAVKFTEHGAIALRAELIEPAGDTVLVRFEVADTGIGVAHDQLPRLFQAFEQADASTTRRHGGTGLGLAITLRLARLMGGEAGASSEPGIGSRFWFTARLARGRAGVVTEPSLGAARAEALLRERHQGRRVLLAEDHPVNREVAVEQLAAVGLVVDVAEDGVAAIEMVKAARYDLVLMDMQMPRIDGLAATRAIRALPDRAALPIVAMTANAFEQDREACAAAGMNDFVTKPTDPQTLYTTLLRWLPGGGSGAGRALPAAPADRETLALQRVQRIDGLDPRSGLALVCGNAGTYLRLLRLFADTHRDDPARLRQAAADADRDLLSQRAHTLKSAAGSIGAAQVQHAAAALEAGLTPATPALSGDEAERAETLAARVAGLVAELDRLANTASTG
ncbi:PAS domain S-box protein [Derxia lacustris]|uniref:PAS domain S-box protein n=1 Tax=Derxia lacustris TaxID=764842 RepID=UPI000A1716C9|nr:PAS domain S-box protein [Derxia lacustris]